MKKIILGIMAIVLFSCNNKGSLQKYFVENSESSNFISLDVTPSIINTEKLTLSQKDKETLNSFEKMNILAFKKDSLNVKVYDVEKEKVKGLLKDEVYQELLKIGSGSEGGALYYVGDEEKINEFVLFANSKENGFAVVRILGDDMNPTRIMNLISLINKSDVKLDEFKALQNMLK